MDGFAFIQQALLTGIIATLVLDLWQLAVERVWGIPATNWAIVGRWVSHIPRGKLVHQTIVKADAVPYEAVTGWITHYAVGFAYAAIYLLLLRFAFGWEPGIATALGFGFVTVAAPWFLMQPAMGMGMLARKTPKPSVARIHSLSSHAFFGLGLCLAGTLTV